MVDTQHHEPPDSASAWRRARRSMRRLFDALADLDDAGGVAALADAEAWPEARVGRAVADMNLVRRMLRVEVSRLRGGPDDHPGGPAPG